MRWLSSVIFIAEPETELPVSGEQPLIHKHTIRTVKMKLKIFRIILPLRQTKQAIGPALFVVLLYQLCLEFIFHTNSVQATKIAVRIRTKVLVIADIINTQINLGVFIEMFGGHDISNGEVLRFINEVTMVLLSPLLK